MAVIAEQERSGDFRYRRYLLRRFVRLYIPYCASGLVAAAALDLWGHSFLPNSFLNYALASGVPEGISMNPPSWSLVFEMRICIVVPLLVSFALRGSTAFLASLVATAFVVETLILATHIGQFPYTADTLSGVALTTGRFTICFGCGVLLATKADWARGIALRMTAHPLISVFLIYCLSSVLLDQTSVVAAVLIIAATGQPSLFTRYLNNSVCQWLGRISFSLYLTHFTVLSIAFGLFPEQVGMPITVASAVIASLCFAQIFYILVEGPTLKLSKIIGRRQLLKSPNGGWAIAK